MDGTAIAILFLGRPSTVRTRKSLLNSLLNSLFRRGGGAKEVYVMGFARAVMRRFVADFAATSELAVRRSRAACQLLSL